MRQETGTRGPRLRRFKLCRIFGHRRSIALAFTEGGVWLSRCKHCGRVMVRIKHKQWVVQAVD